MIELDLVARLRNGGTNSGVLFNGDLVAAADEIERLQTACRMLIEALPYGDEFIRDRFGAGVLEALTECRAVLSSKWDTNDDPHAP